MWLKYLHAVAMRLPLLRHLTLQSALLQSHQVAAVTLLLLFQHADAMPLLAVVDRLAVVRLDTVVVDQS